MDRSLVSTLTVRLALEKRTFINRDGFQCHVLYLYVMS